MVFVRNFSRNLRAIRLWRKLTTEELAGKSGLSVSYISMLERDLRSPRLPTVAVLAEALAVTPVDLLFSRSRRPIRFEPPAVATGVREVPE